MKLDRITSIGRPIDPGYPTNRAIALLTITVMLVGTVFQLFSGRGWVQSGLWGLSTGLAVFLAWALCRELDPDRDLSAFVAASLALAGSLIWGAGSLGSMLWILLLLRIVNRTTGLKATILDSLGVIGLSAWLAWGSNWGYLVIAALGLFLDGVLQSGHRRQIGLSALCLGLSVVVLFLNGWTWRVIRISSIAMVIALCLSALFTTVILSSRNLNSIGDVSGEKLNPRRVQVAQVLAVLSGIQVVIWSGTAGLTAFMPMWAATSGAAFYWLFDLARSFGQS
jgi:hypothetical protein